MPLRDYQQEAVDRLFRFWESSSKPCIICAATGAGKSHIIGEIVNRLRSPVLVLQPSKEILEQNYSKLLASGVPRGMIRVCSASAGSWQIGSITLATIGTIAKHAQHCQHFKVVVVDECDVVPCENPDSQYLKFFAELPEYTKIVGLTATPFRNQTYSAMYQDPVVYCRPLTRIPVRYKASSDSITVENWYGKWFWQGGIIYNITMESLQERDFLSNTKYFVAETDWSFVRDVPGRADYDTDGMEKWCDIEANTSRFTQAIKWCMDNNLKTIVFSPNIDMNFRLKNVIYSLGGIAETMDSEHDSKADREAKMSAFDKGKFQFIINVGMMGRGVDVPSVDAVILCRPTKSLAVYMQQVGRCLRIDPSKPVPQIAYVLDLAGNSERFGKADLVAMGKVDAVSKKGWKFKKDVISIMKNGKRSVWDKVS